MLLPATSPTTKTNSLIDPLKAIDLPDVDALAAEHERDAAAGGDRYARVSDRHTGVPRVCAGRARIHTNDAPVCLHEEQSTRDGN